jgi:hypothetical protein
MIQELPAKIQQFRVFFVACLWVISYKAASLGSPFRRTFPMRQVLTSQGA